MSMQQIGLVMVIAPFVVVSLLFIITCLYMYFLSAWENGIKAFAASIGSAVYIIIAIACLYFGAQQ